MRATTLAACLTVLLGVGIARADEAETQSQQGDTYDVLIERSRALEGEGRYEEGAELLARAAAEYPQDFTVALRRGWLLFLAGRYEEAARAYEKAVALSGGQSSDAQAGLGWSLLRMGKKQDASRSLEAAATLDPSNAVTADGLTLARAPDPPNVELFPSFALIGHYYPSHPYKSVAGTISVGAATLLFRHVLVGATYRGSLFAFDPSAELPRKATTTFAQHEGYASAGWVSPRFGALAQFAIADDGSGFSKTSTHFGGTLRYSPWGDGVLSGAYSRYHDLDVARAELSYRIPLGERFWVRPAGALQRAGETLVTGYTTFGYEGERFGAFVGGKYGDEVRPAYLGAPFILNIPERIIYGGWAGTRVTLTGSWLATLSADVHVLERTDGLTPKTTPAMFAALGVARAL